MLFPVSSPVTDNPFFQFRSYCQHYILHPSRCPLSTGAHTKLRAVDFRSLTRKKHLRRIDPFEIENPWLATHVRGHSLEDVQMSMELDQRSPS